jgi:hypothetical protein
MVDGWFVGLCACALVWVGRREGVWVAYMMLYMVTCTLCQHLRSIAAELGQLWLLGDAILGRYGGGHQGEQFGCDCGLACIPGWAGMQEAGKGMLFVHCGRCKATSGP